MSRWYLFILCLGLPGCAWWQTPLAEPGSLPAPRMAPDSVSLEVAFVRIPENANLDADLWPHVDELHLPSDLRKRLLENGLRAGLVGTQLPASLRGLLEQEESNLDLGEEGGLTRPASKQRFQNRAGRKSRVMASLPCEELSVFTFREGLLQGKTYQQAQCLFTVRTWPQGDGNVKLEISSEIHHGEQKQKWTGQEGAFQLDTSRDIESFTHLKIETYLAPGKTLVLSPTPESKGLGAAFLTEQTPAGHAGKLLLIRLARTQLDDLFAPEQAAAPLVTP